MSKTISNYPLSDCRVNGHQFNEISTQPYQHLTPAPDKARKCEECSRLQIHVNGVWCEPPKEPLRKKQQEIDPNQMSLF